MSKRNFEYSSMCGANACNIAALGLPGITWRICLRVAASTRELKAVAAACALVLTGGSAAAIAQTSILDQPDFSRNPLDIRNRPRPDYDPDGVSVGSFLLLPSLQVGEAFNTNIFATESNETSDFITTYSPSIRAVSDWNNHAVAARAYALGGIYADNSGEDFFDYGAAIGGRLDVRRSTAVTAGASWDHRHEDRGSPEDVNGDEPSEYDQYGLAIGGTTRPNRLSLGVEGNFTHFDFQDVTDSTGMMINNSDRNQSIWEGIARLGYAFRSDYEVFVEGNYTEIVYDSSVDDNGVNRDSNGWRADIGVAFGITDTLFGDVYGGYIQRYYDDPTFSDTGSFDLGADVFWSVTPLTTVQVAVARNFVETTQAGASSILETAGDIQVDHELLRNVIVGANVGVSNFQYEGISREDNVWRAGADGRYLINRNFYAGGRAGYVTRDSNAPTESFDQIEVGVFVGAQL